MAVAKYFQQKCKTINYQTNVFHFTESLLPYFAIKAKDHEIENHEGVSNWKKLKLTRQKLFHILLILSIGVVAGFHFELLKNIDEQQKWINNLPDKPIEES